MPSNFEINFIEKLNGKIPDSELKVILQELMMFTENYDISEKETSIAQYKDVVPQCYKAYMVAKKIEGMSSESLKTYNYYLMDFFQHIDKTIEKLTTNDIRIYLYKMQERTGITNRTLDGKRLVINTFLNWCEKEGYISKNPCERISPIKFEVKPREPLSDIELELVRDACENIREKALLETLFSTGARVSEIANLKLLDIDFKNKEVHLFGKGNKHRTSFINAKMEVYLKKYLETRNDDSEYVFVSKIKPYNALTKRGIEIIISNIGKRSGIGRPVFPHLIRHSTASVSLNRGMSVAELQEMLGHSKIDTTMIYAKINSDSVKFSHKKYII